MIDLEDSDVDLLESPPTAMPTATPTVTDASPAALNEVNHIAPSPSSSGGRPAKFLSC